MDADTTVSRQDKNGIYQPYTARSFGVNLLFPPEVLLG